MVPGPLSPEQIAWLDDLRTLLIAGWLTLAVWFGVTLARERPDVPKTRGSYERCNLHSVDIRDCPPNSHREK